MRVWPTCREASAHVRSPSELDARQGLSRPKRNETRPEPNREASAASAAKRAKVNIRRWCLHNRIERLLTLTLRPECCSDGVAPTFDDLAGRAGQFRRRLEAAMPGVKVVLVVEPGKTTGRLHFQGGLDRYVKKEVLEACWPWGFVEARQVRLRGRDVAGEEAMRVCASYLAKYVAKDAGGRHRPDGRHRYEVTQGCKPPSEVLDADTIDEGWRLIVAFFDGELPRYVWRSEEVPDFPGMKTWVGFW